MVSILRMNPQAFVNGNINALRKGQILRMPASADLNIVTIAQARKVINEQNTLWRSYQAQAAQSSASMADPGASGAMTSSPPAEKTQARMELVPPRDTTSGKALNDAKAELARANEDLATRNSEATELRARVQELEKLKADQERMLKLKNDELAALQAKLSAKPVEQVPVENTPVAAIPDTTTPTATTSTTDGKTPDIWGDKGAAPSTSTTPDASVTADPTAVTPTPDGAPGTGTEVTPIPDPALDPATASSEPVVAEPPVATEPEPVVDTSAVEPAPEPEATPWYKNPLILGGAATTGVLGLLGWMFTRKKKPAPQAPMPISADMNFGIPSIATGSGLGASFESAVDEDESRIRQAISSNPQDLWAHLDLLRLYYSRRDGHNFESAASTMYGYVMDPESPQWQEARTMGLQLTPHSALFAAAPDFGSINHTDDQFGGQFNEPSNQGAFIDEPVAFKDEPIGSLDLGSFDDAPIVAPPAMPKAAAPASDFSFDLSLDGKPIALAGTAPPASAKPATPAKDDFNFDFNFDAPKVATAAAAAVAVTTVAQALPNQALPNQALPNLDSAMADTAIAADLSDDFMIGDDAVGTKLDLARAYLDMGDPDGARSMLDEVLAEGNDSQRRIAQDLMARIA
jgi:pilus assembly protein FimV